MVAPLALASSFVMLYLSLKEKSQSGPGPAVNFYVVNVSLPVLIFGLNVGLLLSEFIPFVYISSVAVLIVIAGLYIAHLFLQDFEASEKISDGHFRKMLPARIQNTPNKRTNLTVQMALIQEADSEVEHYESN